MHDVGALERVPEHGAVGARKTVAFPAGKKRRDRVILRLNRITILHELSAGNHMDLMPPLLQGLGKTIRRHGGAVIQFIVKLRNQNDLQQNRLCSFMKQPVFRRPIFDTSFMISTENCGVNRHNP